MTDGGPTEDVDRADGQPDRLDALRTELETEVDALPVAERVARFEHANDVLARELALLDEI